MSDEVDALVESAMGLTPRKLGAQKRSADPVWREKQSEVVRNRSADHVWRSKNAEVMRKMHADPAWRESVAEANRKTHANPVWRAKLAKAMRDRSKPVVQIEAGLVHMGVSSCGYTSTAITAVCRGRQTTAYGYHWRYATPEEVAYFWAERERTGTDGPFPLTDCPDSAKIPQEEQCTSTPKSETFMERWATLTSGPVTSPPSSA